MNISIVYTFTMPNPPTVIKLYSNLSSKAVEEPVDGTQTVDLTQTVLKTLIVDVTKKWM